MKAVVLLSGGMDSAVCLSVAKKMDYEIAALHLNYGQRTQRKEYFSFCSLLEYFNIIEKLSVDVSYFSQIGGSSLTDRKIDVAVSGIESEFIPTSYVPFRNANILSVGVSWAETIGAEAIFIGVNQLDSSGYPDCRQEFIEAFQKAIDTGTKPETSIKIVTPLINFTKKEIVLKGIELNTPFELTWSCYLDDEEACGECDSCRLRLKGFAEAGIIDPINIRKQ